MRHRAVGVVALLALLLTAPSLHAGTLDASWTAPTTNEDGSVLTDLASYRLYYGTTQAVCPGPTFVSVPSPTQTPAQNETVTAALTNLTAGTRYYAAVTAVATSGSESECSAAASAIARSDPGPIPSLTLTYDGKLRDRVAGGTLGLNRDGAFDGTLTVTLAGAGTVSIERLQLQSSAPGSWDTDGGTPAWALGVAAALDSPLLNDPGSAVISVAVPDGGSLRLFAADYADLEFVPGTTLTVTATLADGSTISASTVAGATPAPPALRVGYDGMLRDRVSPGTLGLAADGAFDGTLTVTLSGPSPLTVTRLQLQSSAPGSWDTDAASPAWALGVAATLDGPLLNDPGPAAVNLAVPDGGSLRLFAADYADLEFVPGATLTVTATLADGSTLTGQVVVSP